MTLQFPEYLSTVKAVKYHIIIKSLEPESEVLFSAMLPNF